jgi:hypothetical protein
MHHRRDGDEKKKKKLQRCDIMVLSNEIIKGVKV